MGISTKRCHLPYSFALVRLIYAYVLLEHGNMSSPNPVNNECQELRLFLASRGQSGFKFWDGFRRELGYTRKGLHFIHPPHPFFFLR